MVLHGLPDSQNYDSHECWLELDSTKVEAYRSRNISLTRFTYRVLTQLLNRAGAVRRPGGFPQRRDKRFPRPLELDSASS